MFGICIDYVYIKLLYSSKALYNDYFFFLNIYILYSIKKLHLRNRRVDNHARMITVLLFGSTFYFRYFLVFRVSIKYINPKNDRSKDYDQFLRFRLASTRKYHY